MKRDMSGGLNHRSGSTLLVVLVILGMIAILATAVARSVSGAALELSSARSAAQDESDLRAGIELGVAAILKLGDNMRRANAAADLSGRRLRVRVTNERGKNRSQRGQSRHTDRFTQGHRCRRCRSGLARKQPC